MGAGASASDLGTDGQTSLTKQNVERIAGDMFNEKVWEELPKTSEGTLSLKAWRDVLQSSGICLVGWPQSPLGYTVKKAPSRSNSVEGKEAGSAQYEGKSSGPEALSI